MIALVLAVMVAAVPGASAAPAQLVGVQTHVLWQDVDDAEMRRQLDLVRDSGAQLVRVDVGWASLQQSGPQGYERWYLERLDRLVAAAQARGLKLLLTFMNTPCWASTAPATLKQDCVGAWWDRGVVSYAPADPAAYAKALAFVVGRYRERVAAWEIWNEPNHAKFFKSPDQAADYARLARAAYPAAKAAHPGATIVAGSLSQSDHAFTKRLYDHGIKGHFDAFSVHPYSDDVSPLDSRQWVDARYSFVRGVPAVRAVMLRNGDSTPIWLTESGWSTSSSRTPDAWRNGVSEATQAQHLRLQFQQARAWPWVQANVWFNLKDAGASRNDLDSNRGLRRTDGSPKPAWQAFREAAAASGQSPTRSATLVRDSFGRVRKRSWGTARPGGVWKLLRGRASDLEVSAGTAWLSSPAGRARHVQLASTSARDVDATLKVTLPRTPSSARAASGWLVLRRQAGGSYLRIGLRATKSGLVLRGETNAGRALFADRAIKLKPASRTFHLRVQVSGSRPTTIRARAWRAGTAEPMAWLVGATSAIGPQRAGSLGIRSHNDLRRRATLRFDDLWVRSLRG